MSVKFGSSYLGWASSSKNAMLTNPTVKLPTLHEQNTQKQYDKWSKLIVLEWSRQKGLFIVHLTHSNQLSKKQCRTPFWYMTRKLPLICFMRYSGYIKMEYNNHIKQNRSHKFFFYFPVWEARRLDKFDLNFLRTKVCPNKIKMPFLSHQIFHNNQCKNQRIIFSISCKKKQLFWLAVTLIDFNITLFLSY